jgi:hypothetical protein
MMQQPITSLQPALAHGIRKLTCALRTFPLPADALGDTQRDAGRIFQRMRGSASLQQADATFDETDFQQSTGDDAYLAGIAQQAYAQRRAGGKQQSFDSMPERKTSM